MNSFTKEEEYAAADIAYGVMYPEARFKGINRGDGISWIGDSEGNPMLAPLRAALAVLYKENN